MRKKGMTLIELLGTIAIIGALALIAIPVTLRIVDKTEYGSFRDSAFGLIDAGQIYASSNNDSNGKIVTFECNGKYCGSDNGELLNFNGNAPKAGQVVVDPSNPVKLISITDGKYCAAGTATTLKIVKRGADKEHPCAELDENYADIDDLKVIVTTTSSTAKVTLDNEFAEDEQSGITKYIYELMLKGKVLNRQESKEPTITFKELNKLTEYQVRIKAVNGNGLENSITVPAITKDIDIPIIKSNSSTLKNGYYERQEISIEYVSGNNYYVKSSRKGKISEEVKEVCGEARKPSKCEKIEKTKEIEGNVWYKVNSKKIKVEYDEPTEVTSDYLIASSYDGINFSGSSTITLGRIDQESPTVEYSLGSGTYKIGNGNEATKEIVIKGSDNQHYGNMEVQVYKNGVVDKTKSINNTSEINTIVLDSEGIYKIMTKVYDKAGHTQNKEPSENDWYYQEYVVEAYSSSPKCGYNTCTTSACGSYTTSYSCTKTSYKTCQHPDCGTTGGYTKTSKTCTSSSTTTYTKTSHKCNYTAASTVRKPIACSDDCNATCKAIGGFKLSNNPCGSGCTCYIPSKQSWSTSSTSGLSSCSGTRAFTCNSRNNGSTYYICTSSSTTSYSWGSTSTSYPSSCSSNTFTCNSSNVGKTYVSCSGSTTINTCQTASCGTTTTTGTCYRTNYYSCASSACGSKTCWHT